MSLQVPLQAPFPTEIVYSLSSSYSSAGAAVDLFWCALHASPIDIDLYTADA
jgi:hypothetical protein